MVTADYLGIELFSLPLYQVGHIREMVDRGINKYDLTKLNLKQIDLGS